MSHIFISYSREDIDFARYLRALLEKEGFRVWMDEAELVAGSRWFKEIERGIESCSAFIPIMSAHSSESEWVEREILLAESTKKTIYPVLAAGKPWARLANIQYEDMRAGLHSRLSPRLITSLRSLAAAKDIEFVIEYGDITEFEADIILLKYAQRFFGADLQVALLLHEKGVNYEEISPAEGSYSLIDTQGVTKAKQALFVGTVDLFSFTYEKIAQLGRDSLAMLARAVPSARHMAMTIHGPGFGFDESEALRFQIAGYLDAIQNGTYPPNLERITIVEFRESRIPRLQAVSEEIFSTTSFARPLPHKKGYSLNIFKTTQVELPAEVQPVHTKAGVYVIMPLTADTEDIFYYGIQQPAHSQGLLCEQLEITALSEEIFSQAKQRIIAARVVIAEVTRADPPTYLQLGYAWGKNRPTIVVAHEQAVVDVPCVRYTSIKHLETLLNTSLEDFKAQGIL
jgi:nucleoside 2-deoxyribosyltransferase